NVSKGLNVNSIQGAGLTACSVTTGKLTYSQGQFSCSTDLDTTALEVKELGPSPFNQNVSSLSFDGGAFNISSSGSAALVRLDYTNGPASRSAAQIITGFWSFRAGASFSNDVEFHNNTGSMYAIFASTSLGRFGLGDVTP